MKIIVQALNFVLNAKDLIITGSDKKEVEDLADRVVKNQEHEVMECNACRYLIIVDGQYLVDVDSRDVEKEGKL